MKNLRRVLSAVITALLTTAPLAPAVAAGERQSLEELRNTVVNLLQTLVEQGVMTREQAERLVADAQKKAADDAAAAEQADAGAVRVTYVPQIVRDEISRQVAEDVRPQVVDDVVGRAREERWGVPAALPEWLARLQWSGSLRVRAQSDLFPDENLPQTQLDFLAINDRGGFDRAGVAAFANTTEDRYRVRVQARLGVDAALGGGFSAGARVVTGTLRDPLSANQTLGQYAGKLTTGMDLAYVRWEGRPFGRLAVTLSGGRFENTWRSTELLFDNDLTFDGLSGTVRLPFGTRESGSNAYITLGAHPLEEVELSADDKWLYGGQLGLDLGIGGHRFSIAGAYYDFRNVQGSRNTLESTLLDYTAPRFLTRGNTLFDIRNDLATDTNLFALAGKYEIVDVLAAWEAPLWRDLRIGISGNYVKNIGWKSDDVLANAAIAADERTEGYQAQLHVGHADVLGLGRWRGFLTYRYVQRDAVLDAFADSDFRLGGTDVKGYVLGAELGLARGTWLRLRYIAADEIDGTLFAVGSTQVPIRFPFGVDTVQLDVNAQF